MKPIAPRFCIYLLRGPLVDNMITTSQYLSPTCAYLEYTIAYKSELIVTQLLDTFYLIVSLVSHYDSVSNCLSFNLVPYLPPLDQCTLCYSTATYKDGVKKAAFQWINVRQ